MIDVTTLGSSSRMEIDDGLSTTSAIGHWDGNEWSNLIPMDLNSMTKFIEFCKKEYPNVVMEFDIKEGVKI